MAAAKLAPGVTPHRLVRKVWFGLLGLVGFLLALLVALPYVVSLERVKGPLIAQVEAALQRKVDAGAVRLQILSGLGAGLEDLTVYNPPGWQRPYFIKAGTLSVKVAWRPLLHRRVEITKLLLRDGEVVIERDAHGRLNFADLTAATPEVANTLPAPAQDSTGAAATQPGVNPLAGLFVADVACQNMQLTFVDRMVAPGQEIVTAVSNVQLKLSDVAPGTAIPIDLAATALTDSRQNIHVRGSIGPIPTSLAVGSIPIDVHLRATDVLLDQLTPYLGVEFPLVQGRFGGDVKVAGSIDSSLRINGALSLADAVVRETVARNGPQILPRLSSTQDITVDLPKGEAELTDVQINLSSLQATLKGVVRHLNITPHLDLRLTTNAFAPGELLNQLPPAASMLPTPTDLQGTAQFQATLKGALHDLRSEAEVALTEIALRSGAFGGGAQGSGGVLLETDKTDARLGIHLVDAAPPRMHLDIRAQRLVFDQQAANIPAPAKDMQPSPIPKALPAKSMPPSVTVDGIVTVAEGRLKHLSFQQLAADFELREGVLNTTQRMNIYGGTYRGTMQIDLAQPEPLYTLNAQAADVDVGQAVNQWTSAKNALLGVLNTDLRLAGQGFTWEGINKTLSGDGNVKIAEAKFTAFDLIPKLVQVLRSVGGLAGFSIPDGWEHNAFRTIEADWRLRQGKIATDHLRLRGEGMEALLKGYVGLDQSVDYAGNFFLPAKFIAPRGMPAILRQDDAGRVMLPFTINGTVTAPRISFDEKSLVDLAKEGLADELGKQIGGKLKERLGKPSARDPQRQETDKAGQDTGDQPHRQDLPGKILQELFRR
jgi:AsmA protein